MIYLKQTVNFFVILIVAAALVFGARISMPRLFAMVLPTQYGLLSLTTDKDFNYSHCEVKLVNQDKSGQQYQLLISKNLQWFSFYKMLCQPAKYTAYIKTGNYTLVDELMIYPYQHQKVNTYHLTIPQPEVTDVDLYFSVKDKNNQTLNRYQLYYRKKGQINWDKLNFASKLPNNQTYDFKAEANGYNPSQINNVTISPWQNQFNGHFILTPKLVSVTLISPQAKYEFIINGSQKASADKNGIGEKKVIATSKENIYFVSPGKTEYQIIQNGNVLQKDTINIKEDSTYIVQSGQNNKIKLVRK